MLAGLPPQYGLYCCLVPAIVYCFLGSCGQINIGPCAISRKSFFQFIAVSMMSRDAVNFIDPRVDLNGYIGAMMTLSFVCGSFLLLLGLLRLGFVSSILSETVVTSFTAASAFNIAASQLCHFWGVSTNRETLIGVLLDLFSPASVIMSSSSHADSSIQLAFDDHRRFMRHSSGGDEERQCAIPPQVPSSRRGCFILTSSQIAVSYRDLHSRYVGVQSA